MSINDEEIRKSLEILWEGITRASDIRACVANVPDPLYHNIAESLYQLGMIYKRHGTLKAILNNAADPNVNEIGDRYDENMIVNINQEQLSKNTLEVQAQYAQLEKNASDPELVLDTF